MARHYVFSTRGWDEYIGWQTDDKKIMKKINTLLKETARDPYVGIGKPEPLKNELSGAWSRRITDEHRLVYIVQDDSIEIVSCRSHYDA